MNFRQPDFIQILEISRGRVSQDNDLARFRDSAREVGFPRISIIHLIVPRGISLITQSRIPFRFACPSRGAKTIFSLSSLLFSVPNDLYLCVIGRQT